MSDLEAFRAWFNGLAVMGSLGVECVALSPGRAVSVLRAEDRHRNPDGSVNGGYLAAAADVTAGAAVTSTSTSTSASTSASSTGVDAQSATADLSLHYLAAAVTGPFRVEAEVLRRGRSSCVPTVRITDAGGTLCVVATGTWVLR